jgi:tetratricopeptide (TPR) repeat protein
MHMPQLNKLPKVYYAIAVTRILIVLTGAVAVLRIRSLDTALSREKQAAVKMSQESAETKTTLAALKSDRDKLAQNLESVTAERDTLLQQVKELAPEKELARKLEKRVAGLIEQHEALEKQRRSAMDDSLALKARVNDLEIVQKQMLREKEELQNTLAFERDKTNIKNIQDENAQLKKEVAAQAKSLREVRAKLETQEQREAELKAQVSELNGQVNAAASLNKEFSERVVNAPGRLTDLSRHNETLVKETAATHYNLGVYYMKRKEYPRAVAELHRAISLNPRDPNAHFNLGYIYAEHLVNRPKAIESFKKYLQLSRKDDKDRDWAQKYILTWETWDNKAPMQ